MKIRVEFEPGEGCGLSAIEVNRPVESGHDFAFLIIDILDNTDVYASEVAGSLACYGVQGDEEAKRFVDALDNGITDDFIRVAFANQNASPTGESSVE